MSYPSIKQEISLLRKYGVQKGYTSAQLATNMTTFGWTWTETHIDNLFAGRAKLSSEEKEFVRRYLLTRYYDETIV